MQQIQQKLAILYILSLLFLSLLMIKIFVREKIVFFYNSWPRFHNVGIMAQLINKKIKIEK